MIRQMLEDGNFCLSLVLGAVLLLFISEVNAKVVVCETNTKEEIVMGVADLVKTVDYKKTVSDGKWGGTIETIYIKDVNNYNEVEDYLVREQVKNGKTYRMTYSLTCEDAK